MHSPIAAAAPRTARSSTELQQTHCRRQLLVLVLLNCYHLLKEECWCQPPQQSTVPSSLLLSRYAQHLQNQWLHPSLFKHKKLFRICIVDKSHIDKRYGQIVIFGTEITTPKLAFLVELGLTQILRCMIFNISLLAWPEKIVFYLKINDMKLERTKKN